MALVSLSAVRKTFVGRSGEIVHAVNGVSLEIEPRQTLGLIGESGSGKSTVGRLALGLHSVDSGEVRFDGVSLGGLRAREIRRMRSRMQVVFQEPYESLNPRMRVADIIEEPLIIHERAMSGAARRERVESTMNAVGLDPTLRRRYPAGLSGGQQQRVGIARAIVTRPQFLVLDEPTSSLDLSVRGQILKLLLDLQSELGLAYLFISHDISTIRHVSHRVAVMYLGQIVETGPTEKVLGSPRHPYTQALLSAVLSADPGTNPPHFPLRGEIPSPTHLPQGCFLFGRCPIQTTECGTVRVDLHSCAADHEVACIKVPSGPSSRH